MALTVGTYLLWYHHRGPPKPHAQEIAKGVQYTRSILDGPIVVHELAVTLDASRIEWLGTAPDSSGGRQTIAATTTAFANATKATVAINTAYFAPWHSNTLLDYYPHVGDPVDCIGATITNGQVVGPWDGALTSLWVLDDGSVVIDDVRRTEVRFAYSGFPLVVDGKVAPESKGTAWKFPHPRTAAALDVSGRTLLLFVVDGRQPSYSEGIAVEPLARRIIERGGHRAILFDGGGSSTMVARIDGAVRVLNVPVHGRHPPGIERPVACNLGLRVR